MDINNFTDFTEKFTCKHCNITCSRESEWNRHIITRKHKVSVSGSNLEVIGDKRKRQHKCSRCSKNYDTSGGLWKHQKKCIFNEPICNEPICNEPICNEPICNEPICNEPLAPLPETTKSSDDVKILNSIVIELIKTNNELQKQNTEIQKQMLEAFKHSGNTIHNNSHNKTFNLQIFLNEQCKDAMNMSEFVDSFELKLEDLESVGELGYVDGMTKIFVDKLNSMDIYKRPIHCSDAKREILYIKDEDRWEREKPSNPKLRKAVRNVSFKNMKLANLWSETYPESKCNESRLNDVYMKIVIQSTGGSGEIGVSEDKIMKRITKGIVIDKSSLY